MHHAALKALQQGMVQYLLDFGHFRESRPVDSARVANPGGK
jgi:hypothetical protein